MLEDLRRLQVNPVIFEVQACGHQPGLATHCLAPAKRFSSPQQARCPSLFCPSCGATVTLTCMALNKLRFTDQRRAFCRRRNDKLFQNKFSKGKGEIKQISEFVFHGQLEKKNKSTKYQHLSRRFLAKFMMTGVKNASFR